MKAVLAVCVGLWSTVACGLEPDQIFERVAPSVWFVRSLDASERPIGFGSGVVIAPGRLITNCHVLARARKIQVRKGNLSYEATLEFPDPERDLCQLRVDELSAPVVTMGTIKNLRIGQRVYAIGNPRGLELSMSEGIVSSLRSFKEKSPIIQTTAAISRGSSGGGLFDSEGRLVGITTFLVRDAQNLNFAHPADWIADVPQRAADQMASYRNRVASQSASPPPSGGPAAPSPPAGPAAPSASSRPVDSSPEKILTARDLARLFQADRVVRMSAPMGLNRLVFRSDGHINAEFNNVTRAGTHRVAGPTNQLCLDFFVHSGARTLPFLNDCFTVSLMPGNQYRFVSTDRHFVMIGEL